MRNKNYVIEDLEIIDAGSEGKAVGKKDGLAVFVPFLVPGDVADVMVFKKKKGYAEAKLVTLKKASADRVSPVCLHFGVCGGCKWQQLSYPKQLFYKQKQVEDNFKHLGKFDYPPLLPIVASEREFYYRNKLEYTFSDLRWLSEEDMQKRETGTIETRGLGFHIPGRFDKILDIDHCYLQADPSNAIRLAVKKYAIEKNIPFYNAKHHEGILRNLIIRTASTGELMLIVVFTEKSESTMNLMDFIGQAFPEITSLQYVVNNKLNDTITDLEIITHKGRAYISEKMENLTFKIGPVSFYQTNSEQAYNLYRIAREFAKLSEDDVVYDLYTGTGTIANFVAGKVKKVVGIEYVEAAIEDAKENAKNNAVSNTVFYAGDMAKVLTSEFVSQNGSPDVVITDPPRAGMHPKVVEQLIEMNPERIVYISCNPATQARDISLLASHYCVTGVQPVDMFPHTHHVENVAVLERIEK